MSCIELHREDLCHFHLLSIENIADFVTCSSIRAVRAHACMHACVCVCLCVVVGDGGGQIYSKSSRQGGGVWGELANVAPIVDKLFKKLSRFSSKTQVTPLIFTSKSRFSEHLHASVRSHHTHFNILNQARSRFRKDVAVLRRTQNFLSSDIPITNINLSSDIPASHLRHPVTNKYDNNPKEI